MTLVTIRIPVEALDMAVGLAVENPEISDSDLGGKLRNRFGDALLGEAIHEAVDAVLTG